jgi:hypothetical protein
MEYKKYYEYFYNKTYAIGERKIKETIMKSRAESLVYHLNNNIIKDTQNILITKKSNIKLFDPLNNLATIFANKLYSYTENNAELTLKNIIYPEYLKINNDKLPPNYSFNKFMNDFGALNGLNDVIENFVNNPNLFVKMYDDNNFRNFKIPKNNIVFQSKSKNKIVQDNNKSQELKDKINGEDDNLNGEEKAFLFHIMCAALSEKNEEKKESVIFNLPFTELIRLNTIIDFKDKYCFGKNFGDSNNYKILTKGINHFEKTERITFLSTLVTNIKNYQLPKTTKYINTILYKEHYKSKNMKMK